MPASGGEVGIASPWPASGGEVGIASEECDVQVGVGRNISSSPSTFSSSLPPGLPPDQPLSSSRYPVPASYQPISPSHLEDSTRAICARDNNPTSNAGGEVRISETRLSEAMTELQGAVATRYSHAPTIYRVPYEHKHCLGYDPLEDYYPIAVPIGGFANKDCLQDRRHESKLKAYKWCCVRQLVGRHGLPVETDEARELLRGCMETMMRLLPRVRDSYYELVTERYEDKLVENDEELAQMMLLDGCLILHRLLKYARTEWEEDDDWTLGHCFIWESVTRDLLLLENQIPFFVVKELFLQLSKEGEHEEELLFEGSRRLFHSLGLKMRDLSPEERNNVHHLLHLFYMSVGCIPQRRFSMPYRLEEPPQWIPCAKELEEAGVRFRKRRNAKSFLDISFHNGVLEIPPLQLYDSSSAVFCNLIAFEQTYPETNCDVSAYAVFMGCLLKTPEDMRILHLRGILVNQMSGVQDTCRFFSQISARARFHTGTYMVCLMNEVSRYMISRRHKWRAALVRNYFGNPWLAMSVVAAVLLLGLTVLQTFFTVYPYYKPSK